MSGPIFFNASVSNNTGLIQIQSESALMTQLTFNKTFNANILNRQDDYECSVIRMILPSDNIDILNISDSNQTNYKLGLGGQYVYLPKTLSDSDIKSGDVIWSYRSQMDVVEATNRCLMTCFNAYMQTNYGSGVSYPTAATLTASSNTAVASKYLSGIEVKVGGLSISNSLTAHVAIYFKTNVKETLLWAGYMTDPEFAYLTDQNNPITFSDAALLPFSRVTDVSGVYKFQPMESLLNAVSDVVTSYQIQIISQDMALTGTFKYGVSLAAVSDLPTIPPAYTIDSKGLLTLQVQQCFLYRGIDIEMSPMLFRMFDFGAQSYKINKGTGMYQVLFPSLLLSHPIASNLFQIKSIEQFQSTKYRMNTLSNILVVAHNMNVQSEFFQDYVKENVLQDFAIDPSQDLETLVYSTDGGMVPVRRYRMGSQLPLTNLIFDIIAQYNDGATKKVFIPPGTTFQLKIGFYPRMGVI